MIESDVVVKKSRDDGGREGDWLVNAGKADAYQNK